MANLFKVKNICSHCEFSFRKLTLDSKFDNWSVSYGTSADVHFLFCNVIIAA